MSTTRDVRRLAFQALYQLDARQDEPAETVLESVAEDHEALGALSAGERRKALDLARGAFEHRAGADAFMLAAAPDWPPHRQAAVDRAILRLAHHEMTSGVSAPKIAVNEAIELAKAFSTERSPAFINGLLDKLLKKLPAPAGGSDALPSPDGGDAPALLAPDAAQA